MLLGTESVTVARIDNPEGRVALVITPGHFGRGAMNADKFYRPTDPQYFDLVFKFAVYFAAARQGLEGAHRDGPKTIDDLWAFYDIWGQWVEEGEDGDEEGAENPTSPVGEAS